METHGEINENPLKNDAKKYISEHKEIILKEFFMCNFFFQKKIPTYCNNAFSLVSFQYFFNRFSVLKTYVGFRDSNLIIIYTDCTRIKGTFD